MKRILLAPALVIVLITTAFSQTEKSLQPPRSNTSSGFYFSWGYHHDAYSSSTIHFVDTKTEDYDFTLYHARAKDKPDMHKLINTPLTVPQYVVTLGYYFSKKKDWGIEISWNHLKYVVHDNQMMHMRGQIDEVYYDKDTLVTPKFVHFEHTNGNNYLIASIVRRYEFLQSRNGQHKLSVNLRFGGGVLIPKTDSYIMGLHNDGPFRISGIVLGTGAGLRYDFCKYLFLEPAIKTSYADYTNAKLYMSGRAQHHFISNQYIMALGFNIPNNLFSHRG